MEENPLQQKPKTKLTEATPFKKFEELRRKFRESRKRMRIFKTSTVLLLIVLSAILWYGMQWYCSVEFKPSKIKKIAPYYKEISKIIKPLRYSGIYDLMRPDVKIFIDFEKETWTLENIHSFDRKGNIILTEGRYGLCGELAAYTYEKIQLLFDRKYVIEFVRAIESGYFISPRASHYVLMIHEPSFFSTATYVLDPSFRRYGPIEDFEDYLFFEKMITLPFMEEKNRSKIFTVGSGTPIIIKKGFLMMLVVEKNGDKFDRDNFVMAFTATHRHKYAGRYIYALRKNEGETEVLENKHTASLILGSKEYITLSERIKEFFLKIP